ncbi:MAG: methyltransferase family protein [Terracidiphilus sp.]
MRATKIEFRLRMIIMTLIVFLGFWAPWTGNWGQGYRTPLWAWLAFTLNRTGLVSIAVATPLVIVVATLISLKGVVLRIWGTACLGYDTVHHQQMQAGSVMADGPYRYVRNPLYIGSWCMMAAMSLLMPPSGALITMTLMSVFFLRLILAEEAFLAAQLGQPCQDYLRAVPRFFPSLRKIFSRATPQPTGRKPQWIHALTTEINPIGIFLAWAVFSWRYNNWLMIKVVLISFGLSMVVKALVSRESAK